VPGAVVFDIEEQFNFVISVTDELTGNRQPLSGQVEIELVLTLDNVEPQCTVWIDAFKVVARAGRGSTEPRP
jgi:hypothetical protein